ncbi:E3 ubiquitin-protein ligase TRIM62 [Gouania willdenowi]|uniref:E3 ubiquitin-protein ligase TRIM62-like n=1 Tax=Gouania willdenowi TaxID=441366 RepID=A0A8C5EWL4_GOUWI|nr:E3 ubiquitin-protein ligase TRIM62-like [Gouania willdenowi]
MAEKDRLFQGNGGSAELQSDPGVLSTGMQSLLQDGLSFTPLDSTDQRVVQPFPRSPKLQRGVPKAAPPTQEQLRQKLEELQVEKSRTGAHIRSLKKRKADLSRSTEMMKQQAREHFENMHSVLKQDECQVLESLELDLRLTRTKLDHVLKDWEQHQDQVCKSITCIDRNLKNSPQSAVEQKVNCENISPKKPHESEQEIKLNKERFEKLLKTLSSISKTLKAQLQRKTLLLDFASILIDKQTCHNQITVTSEGRGLSFSSSASSIAESPLQFDKVCCALGSRPVTMGQSYWEVDVSCCSSWAVGVAYARMERKGRDKGAKLGRNRNSWCVELRDGNLSAWHNDRHVACQGMASGLLGRVGVFVNYEKGQLTFYDADSMLVLQKFSAAVMPVFDRVHHQFMEPLYPAVCFLKPPEKQIWPNHIEFCQLNSP